jgi:hypothetical protein
MPLRLRTCNRTPADARTLGWDSRRHLSLTAAVSLPAPRQDQVPGRLACPSCIHPGRDDSDMIYQKA